jgi:[ribosomal protein S5]-alanine N-acetyltransferase
VTILKTQRMLLQPLSRTIIQHRLANDSFELEFRSADGSLLVHFEPDWPGDLLAVFPSELARLPEGADVEGNFVAVDVANAAAIGAIGTKGGPNSEGVVEIGYGFIPEVWGHGFATEAVEALVAHLLALPTVTAVSAQTALANRASERVLEKAGFAKVGTNWEEEDGDLTVWERS